MLNAIATGCKKNILIFNVFEGALDPIFVLEPSKFGGSLDSDIPVVICYNNNHYESLHPVSCEDIKLTQKLVQSYLDGNYGFDNLDLKYLLSPLDVPQQFQKP